MHVRDGRHLHVEHLLQLACNVYTNPVHPMDIRIFNSVLSGSCLTTMPLNRINHFMVETCMHLDGSMWYSCKLSRTEFVWHVIAHVYTVRTQQNHTTTGCCAQSNNIFYALKLVLWPRGTDFCQLSSAVIATVDHAPFSVSFSVFT